MAINPRVNLPRYHPAQAEIAAGAGRFNVVCCGRRTGKTALGVRLLIETALAGHPAAWFAPNYKLLEEVWREVGQRTAEVTVNSDKTAKRRELITGGVIDFWTLDGEDAARGRKYKRVLVDEAAMARTLEAQWQQALRPTLTDLIGEAWFLSTPKGENFFWQLAEKAKTEPDWRFFRFPTSANPYIDPREIESARKELPEVVFRQEYLAEFVAGEGTAVKREHLRVGEPPLGLRLSMGVDLAISSKDDSDYSAAVILGQGENGTVWVMHAERMRGDFYAVMEWIKRLGQTWRPFIINVEQVQFQAAVVSELLRTTALPVRGVRPDRDKVTRFLPLQARYEQGLVVHASTLPPEFERELLAFPFGAHDDFVDAAAYAHLGLGEKPRWGVVL